MESIIQEVNKEQNQQVFVEATRRKIQASLQKLDNKQQQQQQNSSNSLVGGKRFIKFTYDGEHKRLSFMGQHSEEIIPYKDFKTREIVEGKSQNGIISSATILPTRAAHLNYPYGSADQGMLEQSCSGFQRAKMC